MIPDRMTRFKPFSRKAFGLAAFLTAASLGPAWAQQPAPAPTAPAETAEEKARREDDRRAEEAAALLERAGSSVLIVFDERGKSPSSEAFAKRIKLWRADGRPGIASILRCPGSPAP